MRKTIIAAIVALVTCFTAWGKVEIIKFDDPAKRELYQTMIAELRCLVCQNQNLADSNAELAVDLRRRTRELIDQGKTRAEIADYMVARYGEFVLYRPPLNSANLLLWIGPGVLLFIAIAVALFRRNSRKPPIDQMSDAERSRVRALIRNHTTH